MEPLQAVAVLMAELADRKSGQKLFTYYPDTGPLRRELYAKHLEFFRLGNEYSIRGFMAGNRTGKTEGGGGYETTLHLTGRYPEWWEGTRYDAPVRWWAAGDTGKTVRDIIQEKLLGPWGKFGTGLIPAEDIVKYTPKQGVSEAVDTVWVKHYDEHGNYDGDSKLVFKSYDQGRLSFQGTEQDGIWLDEEAPEDVRGECITRLMTTDGILMETFTPLKGITPVVMEYLGTGEIPESGISRVSEDKALVMAGWDDVPHLTEDQKRKQLANTLPWLRDARRFGIPSIGEGAIYPVPESEITMPDMQIPDHWKRLYGFDVGWNVTAAIWGAWDQDADVIYLYAEHYRKQSEPAVHAEAIKAKGKRLYGEIDPASRGRSQVDGKKLIESYEALGLNLNIADNAVETGLFSVWERLSTGRLKVFKSCVNWLMEYRMYHRNEKGVIVKKNDHLMDATRYLTMAPAKNWKYKAVNKQPVIAGFVPKDRGMGY